MDQFRLLSLLHRGHQFVEAQYEYEIQRPDLYQFSKVNSPVRCERKKSIYFDQMCIRL